MAFFRNVFGKNKEKTHIEGKLIHSPIDQLAVVIAAGGDTTRLLYGSYRSKLPPGTMRVPAFFKQISLATMPFNAGHTFLEIALRKIAVLQKNTERKIPCALIVGPNNQKIIKKTLQSFDWVSELNLQVMEQGSNPVIDQSSAPVFWDDGEVFCAPDGTGGCLETIVHSEWLKTVVNDDYKYVIILYINDLMSFSSIPTFLDHFIKANQDYLWLSNDDGQRQLEAIQNTPVEAHQEELIAALEDAPGTYLFRTSCLKQVVEVLEEHLVQKDAPVLDGDGKFVKSIRREKYLSDAVRNINRYLYLSQYEQLINKKPGDLLFEHYIIQEVSQSADGPLYHCLDRESGEKITLDPNKKVHRLTRSSKNELKSLMEQMLEKLEKGETHSTIQIDIGQKKPGEILFDDFLIEEIRQGAFGLVYICTDEETNQTFAIKTFPDELRWAFPQHASRFGEEAYFWVMLPNHPNIVRASQVVEQYGRIHLVLEYVDGGSLRQSLTNQQIPLVEGLRIFLDACLGVQFLHQQGLIHGDIKPENILLTKHRRAKITDLGLSIPAQGENATPGGTPGYQAPEIKSGGVRQHIAADIYSLGVVGHELLTGYIPLASENPGEYPHPEIKNALQKAISSDPQLRSTLDDLIEQLQSIYRKIAGQAYLPAEITFIENENERYTNLANALIAMGQPEKTLGVCDEWLATAPQQFGPKYLRALALYDLQNYSEGYQYCLNIKQGMLADSEYLTRLNGLIDLYEVQLGISKKTAEELEALAMLVMHLHHSGHLAMKYLDAALRLDPSLESAWAFKGECFYDFGAFEESIACYRKALNASNLQVAQTARNGIARSESILSGKGGLQFKSVAYIEQGERLFQEAEYRKSQESFMEALKIDPENSRALLGKGLTELYIGNVQLSIEDLRKCIRLSPQSANYYYHFGLALLMNGEYEEALKAFETTLGLAPDYIKALHNKGVCLLAQDKNAEAKQVFQAVLKQQPGHAKADDALKQLEQGPSSKWISAPEEFWTDQSFALYEKGLLREALLCTRNAIKINPERAINWYNAGYFLWMMGQYRSAIEHCRKALAFNPKEVHAWNILGNALDDIGEIDKALEAYEKAVSLDPKYYEAWNGRGLILQKKGAGQEALESFEKAIQIKADFGRGWYNKGAQLADLDRHEEGIACYRKALEINPHHAGVATAMGLSYLSLDQFQDAANSFHQAIATRPDDADAWCNLGATQFMMGDLSNAFVSTQKALAINPHHAQASQNMPRIQMLLNVRK